MYQATLEDVEANVAPGITFHENGFIRVILFYVEITFHVNSN